MDGHHVRSTKKILGFRWSKKAKITLKTISFRQNISSSFFKFSPFLCTMKACLWNLINFSKFWNALIRKEKKTLMQQSMRKEKLRKVGLCFITGCFIKLFNMIITFLLCKLIRRAIFPFWYQDDAINIKRGSWKRKIARNGKLQYSFQKWFQSFCNEHNKNKFLYWQNMHRWRLVKVNGKISS